MGVLADAGLVLQAQPALIDGGFDYEVSEATDWTVIFDGVCDTSGDLVDFSTYGVVGKCQVFTPNLRAVVATFTYTPSMGRIVLSMEPSETAGLAKGRPKAQYRWGFWLATSDGEDRVPVWAPSNSHITVHAAGVIESGAGA